MPPIPHPSRYIDHTADTQPNLEPDSDSDSESDSELDPESEPLILSPEQERILCWIHARAVPWLKHSWTCIVAFMKIEDSGLRMYSKNEIANYYDNLTFDDEAPFTEAEDPNFTASAGVEAALQRFNKLTVEELENKGFRFSGDERREIAGRKIQALQQQSATGEGSSSNYYA